MSAPPGARSVLRIALFATPTPELGAYTPGSVERFEGSMLVSRMGGVSAGGQGRRDIGDSASRICHRKNEIHERTPS
jgi:hypothetical protein